MSPQTRHAESTDGRDLDVRRDPPPPRFEISVPKVLAGALAAASAAIAASWLGVAGTVVGAVVASVVVSITSALYSHPLERTTYAIREVLPQRIEGRRLDGGPDGTRVDLPATQPDESGRDGVIAREAVWTDRRRRPISWRAVAVSAVLALVVGLGALTAAEVVFGKPASSWTGGGDGGTTVGRILGGGGAGGKDTRDQQPDTPAPTSVDPTDEAPATSEPSDSPTTDTPTTPEPTEPTEPAPTTEPTPTQPTPTAPTGDAVPDAAP